MEDTNGLGEYGDLGDEYQTLRDTIAAIREGASWFELVGRRGCGVYSPEDNG